MCGLEVYWDPANTFFGFILDVWFAILAGSMMIYARLPLGTIT